jgi:hypothetical protein
MKIPKHEAPDNRAFAPRRLFMVLSPRSLPYASVALASLFRNAQESFELSLITDSESDKLRLSNELVRYTEALNLHGSSWRVFSFSELDGGEETQFGPYSNLRSFRRGHPCWRKVTDPILLSSDHQEMIILDPDVYFPNQFQFQKTPDSGLSLMWQNPSCLSPPEVVETAMTAKIPLAHHTDIGVAQWRLPIDLEWLDWLIGKLGSPSLPRSMHVESIVWAALAMRIGGGYLDPQQWLCWHRSQYKRLLLKLGVSGRYILSKERLIGVKCFHAGGEAKFWLQDADTAGLLDQKSSVTKMSIPAPFTELTPKEFAVLQRNRRWLRRFGYYSLVGT